MAETQSNEINLEAISTTQINPAYSIPKGSTSFVGTDVLKGGLMGTGGGSGGGSGGGFGKGIGKGRSLFGAYSEGERPDGLEGIFYDLKQTTERQPTNIDGRQFVAELRSFLVSGWYFPNRQYFQAPRKLYATNFTITAEDLIKEYQEKTGKKGQSADVAPFAFGVEKEVEPKMWLVHYYGHITPTSTGEYRFAGKADDYIAVRLDNSKPEDYALYYHMFMDHPTKTREFLIPWSSQGRFNALPAGSKFDSLPVGKWIPLQKGKKTKIEIMISENPGRDFYSYLYIQYRKTPTSPEEASGFITIKAKPENPNTGYLQFLN